MKKIILSVINDLSTDQRLDKVCSSLVNMGFDAELIGRKQRDSMDPGPRTYKTKRMRLIFEKGPCFYAEYNFRLFLLLLFKKCDILVSNDLDTLLANFWVSRLRRKPLVYDSHEYFTETPELVNRKRVQKIWKSIERKILPRLRHVYTVNESIAELYRKEYGIPVRVVRNVPKKKQRQDIPSRRSLGIPENKKIILLQGAGINIQRGAEEMVEAMQYIDDAVFMIVGGGDVIGILKNMVREMNLHEKVLFIPKQPMHKVFQYTVHADIGITFDKDTNLNYKYSLPNKLFDYIQAGVPVLASPLVEVQRIIDTYGIGETIDSHDPVRIAGKIRSILRNEKKLGIWQENLKFAARELCWEREELTLKQIFLPLG
ncbi:MAG: glycosyltransferase [Bacteroidales bacterium]